MIRLFIEGQELDVNEGFTHQITYAVDDINNIDSKATAFSKTIVLPGTSNNNKLLGNIFEFGNSNFTNDFSPNVGYNFNAAKSAKVLVEINGLIILKGAMRLMEIIIDGENIEYEVALFGELGGFVAKLGNQRLQDLDFSQYDHTYNATNIVNSWNESESINVNNSSTFSATNNTITINSSASKYRKIQAGYNITITNTTNNNGTFTVLRVRRIFAFTIITVEQSLINETDSNWDISINKRGSGYYYPLIDYGKVSTEKQDFYYKTFRPAFYVREYIDKIITSAGYTWESYFFNTDFFRRLIIPNNDSDFLKKEVSNFLDASLTTSQTAANFSIDNTIENYLGIYDNFYSDYLPFTVNSSNNISYQTSPIRHFKNTNTENITIKITYSSTGSYFYFPADTTDPMSITIFNVGFGYYIKRGGQIIQLKQYDFQVSESLIDYDIVNTTDEITLQNNDEVYVFAYMYNYTSGKNDFNITTFNLIFEKYPTGYIPYEINNTINVNNTLPYNVLQKDFFASILKMFNLMVTEDKYKEKHLIIEPWVDFYNLDRTSYLDWSEKMDRSEPIRIKPMSEVNSRYYEFKYKSDSDYYNEKYRKKYNEGYGDRKFDNQLEFAKETSTSEVIFSATPLVNYPQVNNGDKVISTIFKWDGTTTDKEEKVASNIRILQVKKITDVLGWSILADDPFIDETPSAISGGSNLTAYGYAGHLDNPDAPNSDLNFGATNELYFTLATGALSNNMFNAYYSSYMAEITDKDSRLLSAKFKLTEKDIFNIDFGRFIWVDGILYRLIKIYDYSEGELCKVDLLRVIYTTY